MKQQWQKLALRVDAMQLRERVFLFLAILICALALADTVWLSPAQLVNKQAKLRFAAQGTELQRLRDEAAAAVANVVEAFPATPTSMERLFTSGVWERTYATADLRIHGTTHAAQPEQGLWWR